MKKIKLNNNNYNDIYSYVEAIEYESVDAIKKLTTNVIREDIVLKIYKNNLLTVKRLKFILEKCMNYLYISISLLKRLMKNNDIELLKIIFNSINFFDTDFIKTLLFYYKNKTPIAKADFIQQIKNYRIKINEDIFKNFIHYDCDIFFFCACYSGYEHFAKFLVKHGVNIDEKDKYEETPLFYACKGGNEKIIKYLIEHGANINKRNYIKETPLLLACRFGNETLVKYLIEHGAEINQKSRYGEGPLFYACEAGNESIVRYLIESGVNINEPNSLGVTPFFAACKMEYTNIQKYLMMKGADINIKNNYNESPLSYAFDSRKKDLIDYLLNHGGNADIKDFDYDLMENFTEDKYNISFIKEEYNSDYDSMEVFTDEDFSAKFLKNFTKDFDYD